MRKLPFCISLKVPWFMQTLRQVQDSRLLASPSSTIRWPEFLSSPGAKSSAVLKQSTFGYCNKGWWIVSLYLGTCDTPSDRKQSWDQGEERRARRRLQPEWVSLLCAVEKAYIPLLQPKPVTLTKESDVKEEIPHWEKRSQWSGKPKFLCFFPQYTRSSKNTGSPGLIMTTVKSGEYLFSSVQFSSVQLLSPVRLFATP